jgi:hypothetical protein
MRYLTRLTALAVTVGALLMSATSASAAVAPGYEEFIGCPGRGVNAQIVACFTSVVHSGNLKLGSKDTPITDPIRLTGGIVNNGADGGGFVVGTFNGGTQQVPGGIIGLTGFDWLINLFPGNLLKLYAKSELVSTAGTPFTDPFTLKIKVKLENPLLSNTCYIGSNANPIVLNLHETPTSEPVVDPGLPGPVIRQDADLRDNAFAVPAASGCGFLGLGVIDALVNAQAGLPAATGNNTLQHAHISLGGVQAVYPPAGFGSS